MRVKCGIVGLPNVGKSTLFNALTAAGVAAENFPFCTIEPNTGIVAVPDARLDALSALAKPQKTIPATVEFVDIAGLVAGASQGEGLGNQFLANIRETNAIAHVVRCFQDGNVAHVAADIDAARDVEIINLELALADLETVGNAMHRISRIANSGDQDARRRLGLLADLREHLNQGRAVRSMGLDQRQLEEIRDLHLLTAKPVLYIANMAEDHLESDSNLARVQALAEAENAQVVPLCNKLEAEIAELEDGEKKDFLQELGLAEAGLDRVIQAAYKLLGLQTFFTAGPKEVRAWTIKTGAVATEAAAVIHTDFARGFIRAEVISCQDFLRHGGEAGAREAGRLRLEGKDYQVQDGDVMHFRFNV